MSPDVSYASRLDTSVRSSEYQNFETSYFEFFPAIQRVLSETDLSRVLQIICEEAVGVLGANRSMLLRLRADGGHEVAGSYGMPEEFAAAAAAHRGPSVLRDILKRGEIEVVPEVSRDFRSFQHDVSRQSGHVTLCAIPLEAAGAPIGGLFIYFLRKRNFTLHERRLATSFGQLAALMIEKAELVSSLESRVDEQRSLERALRHIASNQKVDEIIQAVLSESKPIMGTDRCSVMLPHQKTGELRLFIGQGISASFVDKLAALPEPFPIGSRYVSNPSMDKPTIIPDATQDPVYGKIQAEEGNQTMAVFPLRLKDRNLGAMFFFWPHPQEIGAQKIALGQTYAYQVAIAFEKARLFEEERDSRNFLMSVIGDAADAVIITGFDRRITLWNTGAERVYGYTKEEALGSHITLIMPERMRDAVLKNGSRVREHKESVFFEAPMRAKSGKEIPASIALSPVSDEDGNIVAVASIHKDLTERNRAEQSLRDSEERLRSIYDAANDAIS
ncbi:MAG: GAF domain-containing protein [bacterium]|nr:GAF domain-containing protein [bacterium]